MTRFRVCPIALTLAALGTLSMLAGAFLDVDHPAFRFGLIAFLIGASAAIMSRTAATNGAIEAARQAGYDSGYQDASEAAVPVSNVRHLTLSRAAQKLSEERNVGS